MTPDKTIMQGTDIQGSHFSCTICGKQATSGRSAQEEGSRRELTTDPDAANKRHIRYCRRKSATGPRSRTKSCHACVRAKTRCELDFTGCERCTQKGIACSLTPTLPNLEGGQDVLLPIHDLETEVSQNQAPNLNPLPFGLSNGVFPWQLFGDSANGALPNDANDLSNTSRQLFGAIAYHTSSAMMASTIGYGILRSYPLLAKDMNNPPPFIHPRCYGSEENGWALPKSLANAVAIASGDSQEDNLAQIRLEQRRISRELWDMGIEDLLSSLQALIIYALMRIADGPSTDQDDIQLSQTLTHICGRIPSLPGLDAQLATFTPWRRWIIIETKRRINSVLRLMWQLYHLDVGLPHPCHRTAWTSSPLPASKLMWKASTEADWESEREADAFYRQMSHQDLLLFKGCTEVDGQPSRREWARWYAGADELGILVVISASLI